MSHDPSDCDGGPYPLGRFPSLRRRLSADGVAPKPRPRIIGAPGPLAYLQLGSLGHREAGGARLRRSEMPIPTHSALRRYCPCGTWITSLSRQSAMWRAGERLWLGSAFALGRYVRLPGA